MTANPVFLVKIAHDDPVSVDRARRLLRLHQAASRALLRWDRRLTAYRDDDDQTDQAECLRHHLERQAAALLSRLSCEIATLTNRPEWRVWSDLLAGGTR